MRRLARYTFSALAAVSLFLCAATLWLRAREGRMVRDRHELVSVYVKSRYARYTVRADAGGVGWYAPPAAVPPEPLPAGIAADPRPAAELLTLMRSDGAEWGFPPLRQSDRPPKLTLETLTHGATHHFAQTPPAGRLGNREDTGGLQRFYRPNRNCPPGRVCNLAGVSIV